LDGNVYEWEELLQCYELWLKYEHLRTVPVGAKNTNSKSIGTVRIVCLGSCPTVDAVQKCRYTTFTQIRYHDKSLGLSITGHWTEFFKLERP